MVIIHPVVGYLAAARIRPQRAQDLVPEVREQFNQFYIRNSYNCFHYVNNSVTFIILIFHIFLKD